MGGSDPPASGIARHFRASRIRRPLFEAHGALRRELDSFERIGVAPRPSRLQLDLEDAEVPQLQPIAFAQLLDHLVEEGFNNCLDRALPFAGGHGDPVDELFPGGSAHGEVSEKLRFPCPADMDETTV